MIRTKKSVYRSVDRSLLHRFLKEEGYNRVDLGNYLDLAYPTLDKYLSNPHLFNINHIKLISECTGVDLLFLIDIIYEHPDVNKKRNKRNL